MWYTVNKLVRFKRGRLLNFTILAVGKIKEKFYTEAISEFTKRLSRYGKIRILEVEDEKTPDKASPREEEQIKEREGNKLLRLIKDTDYVCVLAIEGKEMDSVAFSRRLEQLFVEGKSNVVFVIGGSLGLSEDVKKRADWKLSFSPMTFPHQLMRVILLEQLYRACRIQHNEPYHK